MTYQLNGERIEARANTLAELLQETGFDKAAVATAVNGSFVPAPARASFGLADGDTVEVLAPMQGG